MTQSDKERLSSIIRVRNRLGSTADSQLPDILAKLLPRLFRNLEPLLKQLSEQKGANELFVIEGNEVNQNSLLENSQMTQTCVQVDRSVLGPMIENIMATISHAIDRIATNVNLEVDSWLPTLLPLLYEVDSKFSLQLLMKLLKIGIGRVGKVHLAKDIIPSLLETLDNFFHDARNAETISKSAEKLQQSSSACAWLLMDAIGALGGFTIVDENGRKVKFPNEWENIGTDVGNQDSIKSVIRKDGCGFIDLLLDMTLLCSVQAYRKINSGVSENGWKRMLYRYQDKPLGGTYLKQLHKLLMHFAYNSLQDGKEQSDRFCLLTTLSSYRWTAKDPKRLSVQEILKGNRGDIEEGNCSIRLACCLLILIVGHEDAIPLLRKYNSFNDLWREIIGSQPLDQAFFRPPLPAEEAGKAIKFITQNFSPSEGEPRIELIISLIILVQEKKIADEESGISLLHFGYQNLRLVDESDKSLKVKFWNCCISTASENASNVLANDVADARNSSRENRSKRSRRGLLIPKEKYHFDTSQVVRTRSISYTIIADVVSEHWKEVGTIRENFDLLKLLFSCAALEDSKAQSCLSLAIKALLKFYKNVLPTSESNCLERQCIVAPILPSLLFAASSGSFYSRIASLECCSDLMKTQDPDAARFICWYLQDDPDPRVTKRAKDALTVLQKNSSCSSKSQKDGEANVIIFLDMSNEINTDLLLFDFNSRIDTLSKEFSISSSTAKLFLQENKFDMDETRVKILSSRSPFMTVHGITTEMIENTFMCDICYDDFSSEEGFALSCKHLYCRSCWRNHLISKAEEMPMTFFDVSCPHHDCDERLSALDINKLEQHLLPKWKSSLAEKVIANDKTYSCCPGTDCKNVAHSMNSYPKNPTEVCCSLCHRNYCFQCKKNPHHLVSCSDFDSWSREIVGTAELWINKNAKPCPSCKVPIEKNQGCNHMICAHCNKDFCWICLEIMDMNAPHVCNQFIPAHPDDSVEINRFFTERYNIHEEEEFFCRDEVKSMKANRDELECNHSFMKEEHFYLLHDTLKVLVEARIFLKHSYISAWAYKKRNQTNHKAFECHQATLELFTERLGRMAHQTSFKEIHDYGGLHDIDFFFRGMKFHLMAVKMYIKRIEVAQISLEQDL